MVLIHIIDIMLSLKINIIWQQRKMTSFDYN